MKKTLAITGMWLTMQVLLLTVSQGTIMVGIADNPTTLDTLTKYNGASLNVASLITETLIKFDTVENRLIPWLATSWESNEDATSWTFSLRSDVTFHDGTPFNAEAVKYNFERANEEDGTHYNGWNYVFDGPVGQGVISTVEAVDEHTVNLVLAQPTALLPEMLAAPTITLHSPAAIEASDGAYGTGSTEIVGTGPLKVKEWIQNDRISLDRNTDYWFDFGSVVDQVVFLIIPESSTRVAGLIAGNIDLAVALPAIEYDDLSAEDNIQFLIEPASSVVTLAMHQGHSPLENSLIRRAIGHAIDREAIVEALYVEGLGSQTDILIPPSMGGAEFANEELYWHDPEQAKELLVEADYPDGFTIDLWYLDLSSFHNTGTIAEIIQGNLEAIGIDTNLNPVSDINTFFNGYSSGEYPMFLLSTGTALVREPYALLQSLFGFSRASERFGWEDQDITDLLDSARQTIERSEREAIYGEVLRLIADHAIIVPIASSSQVLAYRLPAELEDELPFWFCGKRGCEEPPP